MVVVGSLASLKLVYGYGSEARVGRSFAVQVWLYGRSPVELTDTTPDSIVGVYDARHCEFRAQFTVETGVTPREPDFWVGRFR